MDWHPEDIKAALRKSGSSLAALGRSAGVSTQAMSITLHARVSERCENVIAEALGKRPSEIWPSRYRANGCRISQPRKKTAA